MIIVNKGADYSALGLGRAFIPEDQISNEVKAIMANYSGNDIVKMSALQEFFDSIGSTLKAKLRNMVLPLFANTTEEAVYDIIQGNLFKSMGNNNPTTLNTVVNRSRITESGSNWPDYTYKLKSVTSEYSGCLTITLTNEYLKLYGCEVGLDNAAVSELSPSITGNKKIIGIGVVDSNSQTALIRLGDTPSADKVTIKADKPNWYEGYGNVFGKRIQTDVTKGVRIIVTSEQLLTVTEAKTLRDAVKALDDKFYD